MKKRNLEVRITTPITDNHWYKIAKAIQATATIGIMDEYVKVKSIPYECISCTEDSCEGCKHHDEIWEVIT